MFCMGQSQSKGVALEDEVVEKIYHMALRRRMNVVPTCVESEVLQRSNSRELLVYTIVTILAQYVSMTRLCLSSH